MSSANARGDQIDKTIVASNPVKLRWNALFIVRLAIFIDRRDAHFHFAFLAATSSPPASLQDRNIRTFRRRLF